MSLDYQANDDLTMATIVKHTGEQYFQETLNSGAPNQSKIDSTVNSYTSVDLTSAYHANNNIEVYGGVDNVLDADVDDAIGSTVGRFFYVGMRANY